MNKDQLASELVKLYTDSQIPNAVAANIFAFRFGDDVIGRYTANEMILAAHELNQAIDENDDAELNAAFLMFEYFKQHPSLINNSLSKKQKLINKYNIWQLITYGAPGTGKSYKIKGETAGEKVFRTTFHPDSDYATFVGAYKPIMKPVERTALVGKVLEMADVSKVSDEYKKENVIAYSFVEQVFTKAYIEAWANQKKTAAGGEPEKVYLVIEEINRGNCAQIFGDLFQLLDRNDSGFSDYPIKPDSDFGKFIAERLSKVDGAFDATRKEEINVLYPEIEDGVNVIDAVMNGELLLLPDNLYIRATMNTSDQSLFPMDSAFKRRWDWKYIPIKEPKDVKYEIRVGDVVVDWWRFIRKINDSIGNITNSEDKKMGYFFVKADENNVIGKEQIVNKVLFYLYNDAFKDYDLPDYFSDENGKKLSFGDFFKIDGEIEDDKLKQFLKKFNSPEN